jgi:hypothetical protein
VTPPKAISTAAKIRAAAAAVVHRSALLFGLLKASEGSSSAAW